MSSKVKVSDLVSNFFEQKKTEHVFLLSGGMMMHLLDSVSKSSLKYVCMHHEQGCSIAAEAYARVNGNVALCYATSGPGATNTVTGIAGAFLDSAPVVFITGQSRTTLTVRGVNIKDLRMMGNFEVDIVSIVSPITKYAAFVDKAENILYELEKAYALAKSGRPGPVLLDIPLDIQGSMVDESQLRHYDELAEESIIDKEGFAILAEQIKNSKRPLIIAGNGIRVAGQVAAFRELIHHMKIPVVATQLANDVMPYTDEYYVGKPGLRGDRAGNFATQTADLVISIGCSLHITTTGYEPEHFAPNAFKVEIDIDSAVLEKNKAISQLQIKSDVAAALSQIKYSGAVNTDTDRAWRERIMRIKSEFPVIKEGHTGEGDSINTYFLVDTLSDLLKGDEIVVTDAGSLYYITGQTLRVKADQRVIVSGALGAMGYALPASIGASFAAPDRRVICLTGDGSMQTNVQELQTVSNYQLNCTIIVINNKGYASIRNSQASFLDGHIAASSEETGVTFPNWEQLAGAYSLPYMKISRQSEMNDLLKQAVNFKGPLFVEVVIPEHVVMMPSVISTRLDNGSFKSNKLHEMSPIIDDQPLLNIEI